MLNNRIVIVIAYTEPKPDIIRVISMTKKSESTKRKRQSILNIKLTGTHMKKLEKKTNKKNRSRTNWDKLKNIRDADIDTSDIPILNNSFWDNAVLGSPLVSS